MLLTVSKRLEFSASRRLFVQSWSAEQNRAVFGPETSARYGTGRNYVAFFVFSGNVNPKTGMLVNISEIKERADAVLHTRFDHKFLNEDNPAFFQLPPTTENIARQLFSDTSNLFAGSATKLVACHLRESSDRSATAPATESRSKLLVRLLRRAPYHVAKFDPGRE
jgi:6-pyruvoyltetrahydropterin/6-carboxytetrahydropterin synthase